MIDLIDIPDSPSPRLAWLTRHGLSVGKTDAGQPCVRNRAHTRIGFSDTDDGAVLDYCERWHLKHWLVEQHETDVDQDSVNFD